MAKTKLPPAILPANVIPFPDRGRIVRFMPNRETATIIILPVRAPIDAPTTKHEDLWR
jgi:hypothetical protein